MSRQGLEVEILEAIQLYEMETSRDAGVLVMRPEIRSQLCQELGKSWDYDLNRYMGMYVSVCDAEDFPNFKIW